MNDWRLEIKDKCSWCDETRKKEKKRELIKKKCVELDVDS